MKTFINIILKDDAALSIKACGKEDAKGLVSEKLGFNKEEVEILIFEEPDPVGHSIDVNGYCNKGCC